MRDDLFRKVLAKTALAILTDDSDNIIWETDKSPVSGMYRAYFKNKFSESKDMILYASQAGIAMGIMAGQIPIRECHAVKVSEGGLRLLKEEGVKSAYEEIIPLIKSSKDDNIICPIEQFLYEHKERQEQWRFLEARFKGRN